MKTAPLIIIAALAGCATSGAGLYKTDIKKTVYSEKPSSEFAVCVAEALGGSVELRSSGEHYWVMRIIFDTPRHRWDFTPVPGGSKAELRSTGLAGSGAGKVEACALTGGGTG